MLLIYIVMYLIMFYSNFLFFLSFFLCLMIMVITISFWVFELLSICIYKYSCRSDIIYICGSQMIVLY